MFKTCLSLWGSWTQDINNFATAWWVTVFLCIAGVESSVLDFADLNKMDGPTESCEVPEETQQESCAIKVLHSLTAERIHTKL